jgi:hypothetical protein
MKFLKDLTTALLGLVLAISFLFSLFSAGSYFFGSDLEEIFTILQFSLPALIITSIIAWRKKEVFWSMFGWMFPGL